MLIQSNAEAVELKKPKAFYKKFIDELVLTLNSRARPYSNVHELEKDYAYDTGFNPQLVAMEFGFPTFDAFLKSDFMRAHVQMTMNDDGEPLFLPHENPIFKHIRDHQLISQNHLENRKEKAEREKYARAMQPEFRGNILEGKRRLVQLAYELGAETKDICYSDLQAEYLKKFDNMLGPEELRKFFARSNVGKILVNYCNDEFVLSKDDTMSGLIFLRLKRPYKEIVEMHQNMLNLQKEYEARKIAQEKARPEQSQKNGRNWVKRKKVPLSERQLNLVPILPKVNDDLFKGISAVYSFDDSQQPCSSSFQAQRSEEMANNNNGDEASSEEKLVYFDIKNGKFPVSQFNDGGCTSSNVCKTFEEEYGGKANRKVQNTLRHLHQVHRRSSSSSDEQGEQIEGRSKKEVGRRSPSIHQLSSSSDDEQQEEPSSLLSCGRPSEVLTAATKSSLQTEMDTKPKRPVEVERYVPVNNASLPPMGVQSRWRPEDSSDSEKELDGLTRSNIVSSPKADSNSSWDKGTDRAEALRDFIHAVVHLRSPEFVDLKFLLKTVDALDPNYKVVLESMSLRQFIKRNCNKAVVGMYKDLVLVGWRK